jgi:hypothetical protein
MATWTLIYREGRARVSGTDGRQSDIELPGRMISSQIITVGTTAVVVPAGTQLIQIKPSTSDGDGFYWISPTTDEEDVDATHNVPVYGASGVDVFEEWRNNYEFQHVAALP